MTKRFRACACACAAAALAGGTRAASANTTPDLGLPAVADDEPAVVPEIGAGPVYYQRPAAQLATLFRYGLGVTAGDGRTESTAAFALEVTGGTDRAIDRAGHASLREEISVLYSRYHDHLVAAGLGLSLRDGPVGFALVPQLVAGARSGDGAYGGRVEAVARYGWIGLDVAAQHLVAAGEATNDLQLYVVLTGEGGVR